MQREKAKDVNRSKIRAAAEAIIRTEGMDKLTMRRLAQDASVSIATPYNLFGSKNGVLISLMVATKFDLSQLSPKQDGKPALDLLMELLDEIERFFEKDEEFYRAILREIMVAEDTGPSHGGLEQVTTIANLFIGQAAANGELKEGICANELSSHLATILLAVQGMWASGFFSNAVSIAHVRRSWRAVLESHMVETGRLASAAMV